MLAHIIDYQLSKRRDIYKAYMILGFICSLVIACDEKVTKQSAEDMKIIINGPKIDQMIDFSTTEGGNQTERLKEFGEYCNTNSDCQSGFCVPDGRESVCSQLCLADCPTGWNCKGITNTGSDTTFVCFKDDARICRLCIGDDDCPKGLCYELDGQSVCGTNCESDNDCLSGYQCLNIAKEGEEAKLQCVPKNNSCSCDQTTDGNLRICETKNDFGTCIGRQTCGIETGWSSCDAQEPIGEICNQIDDNCDGLTDNILGLGEVCTKETQIDGNTLICRGRLICNSTQAQPICTAQEPTAEKCNFLDDDCDGNTDEGFETRDQVCTVGVGLCQRFGVYSCSEDGSQVACNVGAGTPSEDVCDGLDNDCDGLSDENFVGVGTICEVGQGVCKKFGNLRCSPDKASLICSEEPGQPTEELCDGLDNDCDGQNDEIFPDLGQICTAGEGLCKQSSLVRCTDDKTNTFCEVEAALGQMEKCDGLDNDCDRYIDEEFVLLGQACSVGLGGCERRGLFICNQNNLDVACSVSEGMPSSEICDGIDNDCDLNLDEGFDGLGEACAVGVGLCQSVGINRCALDGNSVQCSAVAKQPQVEKCDKQDNDCDGMIDNGFDGVGEICEVGIGLCRQVGVKECAVDGSAVICNAQPHDPTAEKCDTLDNDCDGRSDEDFPEIGQICTAGEGACRQSSITLCKADGSASECLVNAGNATPEKCDSLDNDCDGFTDEDFQNLNTVCVRGIGACERRGLMICDENASGIKCSIEAGVPSDQELCDSIDNDCDGRTDEGFDRVGEVCQIGVGACQQFGVYKCSVDGSNVACTVQGGNAFAEKCDGIDNDCDGNADEDFPTLGTVCSQGIGLCQKSGVVRCANDQLSAVCSAQASNPADELCDALDNDCDGRTDESFIHLGEICSVGVGLCKNTGTIQCSADKTTSLCTAQAGSPSDEKCDGLDNDCDSRSDETFGSVGQICSVGVGLCRQTGVLQCSVDGLSASCSVVAGVPMAEKCDGGDNDCDGKTDETFSNLGQLCSVGVGQCAQTATIQCSADGSVAECTAVAANSSNEKCDGADNDCDGKTDETFANIGQVCSTGVGLCKNVGTIQCGVDGLSASCNAVAGSPVAEKCDGADNDCDGRTDETFANIGQVCSTGVGLCKNTGTIQCSVDGLSASCNAVADLPENEKCDGADNDCDGKTDETFANIGQVCSTGVGLCRNTGTVQCSVDGLSASCNAVAGSPVAEKCDGADNDCDSKTDETFANIGQVCSTGVGLCRNTSTIQCSVDGLSASCNATAGSPVVEKCDSGDNDCDGKTDETFANLNNVCSAGVGECLRLGRFICSVDNLSSVCSVQAGSPSSEICDGLDNNCDSSTDELWPTKGQSCTVGEGICRRSGVFECNPADRSGAVLCSAPTVSGNANEVCDYQDDDCDGRTDETFTDIQGLYSLSTQNCGACNSNCNDLWNPNPAAFGVAPICRQVGGIAQCDYNCLPNYFDADGLSSNGCELTPDSTAVYVSTPQNGGVDNATCGNLAAPCATITQGLARSVALNRARVRVGEGVYRELVTLSNGKEVLGGHQRNTWIRNPDVTVSHIDTRGLTSADIHRYGVIASGINSATKLDGFLITSGTPTISGNSYGVYIKDSNQLLSITNNRITAGDGGRGADGSAGGSGLPGTVGQNGLTSYHVANTNNCGNPATSPNVGRLGGTGGQRTCSGNVTINGGTGGWSSCGAFDTSNGPATAGQTALGGAAGVSAKNWRSGTNTTCTVSSLTEAAVGANGSNGADGSGGTSNANANGSISAFHWQGFAGSNGNSGTNGGGGGGGGSAATVVIQWGTFGYDIGASGAGGGSGGCAGNQGNGGSAGGGSFGIFLTYTAAPANLSALPVITNNVITRGFGGKGGSGGNGGGGGEGGNGGNGGVAGTGLTMSFCSLQAGNGGTGGRGGHGGAGAGGNGGVSYDILISNVGALAPTYDTANTFTLLATDLTSGTGGTGGNSSNTVTGTGANGISGVSGRMVIR
jgi:hypothetical protein